MSEELTVWRDDVADHLNALDILVNDRNILKKQIEDHLSQVFKWDEIEYNRDFSKITLKWKRDVHPVLKTENLEKLNLDFIISNGYDDSAFRIVIIEVYPFGINEGIQWNIKDEK